MKLAKMEGKILEITDFKRFLVKNAYYLPIYQQWVEKNAILQSTEYDYLNFGSCEAINNVVFMLKR